MILFPFLSFPRRRESSLVFHRIRWTLPFAEVTFPGTYQEWNGLFTAPLIVLAIFALVLSGLSVAHAKGTFNDVQFPRPKSIPVWNQQAMWRIDKDVVRVTSILEIDEKGLVQNAFPADTAHGKLFSYIADFLKTMTFTPLTVDGKKGSGVALVRVLFRPGLGFVDIELAIDSAGAIVDPILYDSMIALNGYSPPRVAKFPSYHCGLSYKDKLSVPPFILFKVSSDSMGNITDARLVKSTMPSLTSQLHSAVRWSKLIPPEKNGSPLSSSSYLAVFFFPAINYPTRPFVANSPSPGATILERSQLMLLPDSAKYLTLPIPKNPPYDSLYLRQEKSPRGLETLRAYVQIDTAGETAIHFPPGQSPIVRSEIREVGASLKFYPALDFSGRPASFYGTIRLEFTDSTLVRIWYEWLPTRI